MDAVFCLVKLHLVMGLFLIVSDSWSSMSLKVGNVVDWQYCQVSWDQGWQYGTVRFEITVRYEIFCAKSTVRNYGTIYFPRYDTVRKYDILFVLFFEPFSYQLNYRAQTTQVC